MSSSHDPNDIEPRAGPVTAQRSNIRAVQEVLDLMEVRRHKLRIEDRTVVFDEEAQADLFNRRIQHVKTASHRLKARPWKLISWLHVPLTSESEMMALSRASSAPFARRRARHFEEDFHPHYH